MTKEAKKPEIDKVPRGPKPEVLKIEGDWTEAVKKSMSKKKPKDGWPKDKHDA
jgi:hypothetical protein